MAYKKTSNRTPEIDPSMIILGLGYVTSLIVAMGWLVTFLV